MKSHLAFGACLLVASTGVLVQATHVEAYSQYSVNRDATNCGACHGDFNSGTYVSSRDGVSWGTHLMSGHNAMMSSDCGACHQSSGRFPVFLNSSAGGSLGFSTSGCVGCHGRTADAGHGAADGRGVGLRQHHDRSGVTICRNCHADANTVTPLYIPVAESVNPFNYFTPDPSHLSKPTDACNVNGTESRYGATGLDNDGNGLYDLLDPACAIVTTSSTTTTTTTTTLVGGTTTTTTTTTTLGNGTTTSTTTSTTLDSGTTTSTTTSTTLDSGTTTSTTTTTIPDVNNDVDDDGISDADDPCINAGAHDITIKPKVVMKRLDAVVNDDGLLVKGEFVSASPFTDLGTDALRVVGLRKDGTLSFDIPIIGEVSGDEKKILFRDSTGANNGIIKFLVKNRSKKAPNQVKVLVKGKNGDYPFASGDEPIHVIVLIGDGSLGDCGETRFTAGQCVFNGAGNTMKCQ